MRTFRRAMSLRSAMEPLTAGCITAVCDCCPALHPLSAVAAISAPMAAEARAHAFNGVDSTSQPSLTQSDRGIARLADNGGRLLIRQAEECVAAAPSLRPGAPEWGCVLDLSG